MSKRSRGPAKSTHRRPGTRPPSPRSARAAREPRPASQLETAAVIAEEIVEEEPVVAAQSPDRAIRSAAPRQRVKPGSVLAAKAATEYVYVAHDLRRIVVLSTILFLVLIAVWLVFVVLRVIPLDFY